jgi:curved DNA-binding protein CbpA
MGAASSPIAEVHEAGPAPAPLDPYEALQLHPRAPHDLVEAVYWHQVQVQQAQGNTPKTTARLVTINEAYAILIDPARRAEHDETSGYAGQRSRPLVKPGRTPIRKRLFSRNAPVAARTDADCYELLFIRTGSSPELVDVAYRFRKTQLSGSGVDTRERQLVDEAYEILSDPERKADYDARLARKRRGEPEEPVAEQAAADAASALAPDALAATLAPEAPLPPEAPPARKPRRLWPFGGGAGEAKVKAPRPPVQKGQRQRFRIARKEDTYEARGDRLAQLGQEAPPVSDAGAEAPSEEAPLAATLTFVDGPNRGQVVPLAGGSLIVGSSEHVDVVLGGDSTGVGAAHARVWQRGGEYILHQLDAFAQTKVNGEPLDLRLAILEPGDEITIGQHRILYQHAAIPASDAGTRPDGEPPDAGASAPDER